MFRWLAVTVFATTALLAQERLEQNGPTTMTLRLGDSAQVELRVIDPQGQVRELQRLLGKKTMENEILREAVTRAAGPKKLLLRSSSWPEGAQ